MITRPTTDQLILDCRRELLDVVLPEVRSEHVRVAVLMVEAVLRNVAVRAAHEIAWMRDETEELEAYAHQVVVALPDLTTETRTALAALDKGPRGSVDLTDVVETYSRAGEALSCALEAAIAGGHTALTNRAADLIAARNHRELEIMGEWTMVGRS